jgi:hypothetical protein
MLFHRLHLGIEALYLVRRQESESLRISMTVLADREGSKRL